MARNSARRPWALAAAGMAVLVIAPAVNALDFSSRSGVVDRIAVALTPKDTETSSPSFVTVGVPFAIQGRGIVAATVSGDFEGAPFELRVVRDGKVLAPGVGHFDPEGSRSSVSFIFVTKRPLSAGCHRFALEWRSPTGEQVTTRYADIVVMFRSAKVGGQICE